MKPIRHRRAHLLASGAAALALVSGLAACGSTSDDGGKTGAKQLAIKLTDAGCSPSKLTTPAGPVTFKITNGGTSSVTEMELMDAHGTILGERENIAPGLSGSFSLNLQPGRYATVCPNGKQNANGVLVVTGKASAAATNGPTDALLRTATAGYRTYVIRESTLLLSDVQRFVAVLQAGDLAQAKALFGPARLHYETIEPVAESFGTLDPKIDARENDVKNPSQWTGFHRIEKILWQRDTTAGTGRYAKQLLADVKTLDRKVRKLTYQPAQLANGAVELLNEVASSKITGEEDRYSHTDLSDFQGNLTGARVAFTLLRPALVAREHGALAATITTRFAAVQRGLDRYKRSTPLGFALYDEITKADRKQLAAQLEALTKPLATVAAKVSV